MVEQHRLGLLIAVDRPKYFIYKSQMASIDIMTFNATMMAMGRRLDAFPGETSRGQRRYPWDDWADGSTWEIRRGEDYDVATENMRVNLHMKADSLSAKVRTHKFDDGRGEGLIFQFFDLQETEKPGKAAAEHSDGTDAATELLYQNALDIYERARREVTIERKDGRRQRYAANRYKQQIDKAYAENQLVAAIGRIVSRRTEGFGHLEEAERPDLMVETLVLDTSKPYHRLFPATTVQSARERMVQYAARHLHRPAVARKQKAHPARCPREVPGRTR